MPKRKRVILPPQVRKHQIVEAAAKAFSEKGYRHTSISSIIARARIARGTFYLYFDSKDQIFRTIVEQLYDRVRESFALAHEPPHIGTDARATLTAALSQWLHIFTADRDAAKIALRDAPAVDARFERAYTGLRREALAFLSRRTREFQDLGLVRPDVSAAAVAIAQLGVLDQAVRTVVLDDTVPDLAGLVEALVDLQWIGLRPD